MMLTSSNFRRFALATVVALVATGAQAAVTANASSVAVHVPFPPSVAVHVPFPPSIAVHVPFPPSVAVHVPFPPSVVS